MADDGAARKASVSIRISTDDSVAFLHDARAAPPPPPARAARARHDRRGRRRAPVHALGGLAAARDARARDRRAAAREGRPRRAADRPGAGARRARRSAAGPRRAGRGRSRGGHRHRQRPSPDRDLPVGRRPHRGAGDRGARPHRTEAPLRADRGRARNRTAGARAGRHRSRDRRRVAAQPVADARRPDPREAPRRSGVPGRRRPGDLRLGGQPAGDGLGGDDPPHLPRAVRLRARHPPPDRERDGGPRARRARARRHVAAVAGAQGRAGRRPAAPARRRRADALRRHPHRRRRAAVDARPARAVSAAT